GTLCASLFGHVTSRQLAVCLVHRKHVRVRGASKQSPVGVGESTVHEQHAWRVAVPMLFPLLRTSARIDRIGPLVSREVHRAVNNKRTGLKRGHLWQLIRADRLQLGDVGTVDLLERGEPISSQGAVVISELLTWGAGNLSAFWAFARGCDRVMHLQFRAGELGVSLVQVRAKRFEDSRSMRRTEWGQGDTKLLFRGFEISGIL